MDTPFSIFRLFFYLGCISFGGPAAHIALFQTKIIDQKHWMSAEQYLQLVALCQFLPGPSSSQVGLGLGMHRAGYLGAFASWLGFTLPGAILMYFLAISLSQFSWLSNAMILKGLLLAIVVIVAHAVVMMSRQICKTKFHYAIVIILIAVGLVFSELNQLFLILIAAILGLIFFYKQSYSALAQLEFPVSKRVAVFTFIVFFLTLFITPILISTFLSADHPANFFYEIYQASALVFGGGHVVLPLLEQSIVQQNFVGQDQFMTGYGVIQTMPGPLFNFSAFLGATAFPSISLFAALFAVLAIFLPAALVLIGALPMTSYLSKNKYLRAMFQGISAGVIALLILMLIQNMLPKAVDSIADGIFLIIAFAMFYTGRLPIWALMLASLSYAYIMSAVI
ncbi:chromate transporter [Acinetobacter marinus]|uniref:Chromate transporter n=1 Tax=Acinetobacter marinus TaxID=281375 RepID=A0A1G6JVS1_9GAMM|nr:chromate efflux transporter [Acinetobacter marinus]SDC22505.1 chromate transporter [Acinetobacter marinus]